jgi:tetratricopeptide (TPR) repeat protein
MRVSAGVAVFLAAFLLLLANSAYLWGFPTPTIFYMGNVLVHIILGLVLVVAGVAAVWRSAVLRDHLRFSNASPAVAMLLVAAVTGIYLTVFGAASAQRPVLYAHIAFSMGGVLALVPYLQQQMRSRAGWLVPGRIAVAALLCTVVVPLLAFTYRAAFPNPTHRIVNPNVVATSMDEEGDGPNGRFWPSSAKTNVKTIPSRYFMDSKQCGTCHAEIYQQWESSVHHFASFNNQFYRKSIEHMQEVQGSTKPSRWCASCHDHAVLFAGKWETPIAEQLDTPEAHTGLGCVSCHSIAEVHNTTGNASFTLEYNSLHEIAASDNPYLQALDRFLINRNPRPHKDTFLKPFMRQDAAEFCSSCHKVHLDAPVNSYRWLRGFNSYDNWQASGVSGQGARSFYYPDQPKHCNDCHMPLVASTDPAAKNGKVRSHRFAAANTAVPFVNGDKEQLDEVIKFLKSGFISVDLFAASPIEDDAQSAPMVRRAADADLMAMSTFGVGEEAVGAGQVLLREVGKVAAPLNRVQTKFQPGSTVRLDVVVRTRNVGHFFPDGTVDAFDVWLEVEGKDRNGKHIFWSGRAEDEGRGPVEPGAHFYKSYQLDGAGNPIDKRNAWQTRSVLYVRLIPPGAADVAHYRVKIPSSAQGPITFTAKLHYRKFAHSYTQFAYAGKPVEGQDPSLTSLHFDSRVYSYDKRNIPANVAGGLKGEIPVLPIVTLAEAKAVLQLAAPGEETRWEPVVESSDHLRWNDWGIGMLLQGDLKGAEYAFRRVMEANPNYADGPLNVARALIQEGETEAAKGYIQKALAIDAKPARIHFFHAMAQKADGDYDQAIETLRYVERLYPRDRVVLNQLGRLYFLKRDFTQAVRYLERVIQVDPEDVQASYTLMLALRGMGDTTRAARAEAAFKRFKADESAQTITARRRMASPEENNERQMIHDHTSILLDDIPTAAPALQSAARPSAPAKPSASPIAFSQGVAPE